MAKANVEIRSLARKHTKESMARLVYWMRSDNPKVSAASAAAILDRGWGKPATVLENSDAGPLQIIVQKFIEGSGDGE